MPTGLDRDSIEMQEVSPMSGLLFVDTFESMRKLASSLLSCVRWAGLLTDVFNWNARCGSGGIQRTAAVCRLRRS
jgi:hypothetical protein